MLKLFPKPAEKATAFVALGALNDAVALFHMAFEFMPRIALDFIRKHVAGTREPFAVTHPWYVLLETSGLKADGTAERLLSDVLEQAGEAGILDDAALARALAQARDFWRLRDSFSLAQKGEGGNIKNDISVPIAASPTSSPAPRRGYSTSVPAHGHWRSAISATATPTTISPSRSACPRPSSWRDGRNWQPALAADRHGTASGKAQSASDRVGQLLLSGSGQQAVLGDTHVVSGFAARRRGGRARVRRFDFAEHGIGQMKWRELARVKPAVELDLMRALKAAFDSKGNLNPGKLL